MKNHICANCYLRFVFTQPQAFSTAPPTVNIKLCTDESILQELSDLCSLVRAAAKTIYEGGYKSVEDIANAKVTELLESMNTVNINKQYYKAKLGIKDMQFIIDSANIILETE